MNIKQLLGVGGWLAALAWSATSHAEVVVMPEDTIVATVTIVGGVAGPECETQWLDVASGVQWCGNADGEALYPLTGAVSADGSGDWTELGKVDPGASCAAGDPLCADGFSCHTEDGVRVCEASEPDTRAASVEDCQTVGASGWECSVNVAAIAESGRYGFDNLRK